jgi:hypothetical protein
MYGLRGVDGVKYSVRRFAARFLFASGAIGAYRRLALRNRAVVLMYHRVMPREEPASAAFEGIRVDPATFELQMAYLRKHFHLLALVDLRLHLWKRIPFPPNSCLVTFDDGWRDNYIHAYPVLNRYEIPAVVFLTVGHIGTRKRFWQDRTFAILDGIRETAEKTPGFPLRDGNLPEGIKVEELVAWPERKFRRKSGSGSILLKSCSCVGIGRSSTRSCLRGLTAPRRRRSFLVGGNREDVPRWNRFRITRVDARYSDEHNA